MNIERKLLAYETVALEAQFIDEKSWDQWLDLYQTDAVFWAPTWTSEATLANDPATQLSFIYLEGRALLEERVHRITSGRSIASMPVPRTTHIVTPSSISEQEDGRCCVKSAWLSEVFDHKTASCMTYAGRYEHQLVWDGERFKISRKKIIIANDHLQSKVDFFYI